MNSFAKEETRIPPLKKGDKGGITVPKLYRLFPASISLESKNIESKNIDNQNNTVYTGSHITGGDIND